MAEGSGDSWASTLQWAKDEGFRAMQFNAVVDTNTTVIRLWESLGFETVGIVPEAFDSARHELVGLRVMPPSVTSPRCGARWPPPLETSNRASDLDFRRPP